MIASPGSRKHSRGTQLPQISRQLRTHVPFQFVGLYPAGVGINLLAARYGTAPRCLNLTASIAQPPMQLITTKITDGRAELTSSQSFDTAFPTNIHLDLARAGAIPNPHLGFNERTVQWVHEKAWRYSASLSFTAVPHSRVCLIFEGLDTFATVRLHGVKILESDNMFVNHRVDVTDIVHGRGWGKRRSDPMTLTIDFESALKKGDEVMAKSGGERVTWNGHYSRVFVRKAQYHYVQPPPPSEVPGS